MNPIHALIYAIVVMTIVLVYLVVDYIGDFKKVRESIEKDNEMTAEVQRIAAIPRCETSLC